MMNNPAEEAFLESDQDLSQGSEYPSESAFQENIGIEAGDDEAEAARIGMADHSQLLGAEVETDTAHMEAEPPPTGGGLSSLPEQTKVVGDEAVGGTVSLPGQNVADDIAESVGVQVPDGHPLNVTDKMYARDERRWELDPESDGRPSEA
ncbi:DUF6335 family protein [Pseudanabaena sp. FACHB-2040]|uniref:DUF6335 family protein n=1 Tax=Pseudanabaena sp. FACHB-2040 TaxID=2692859 RepID=UPI00168A3A8F|nr:DUF6335 family protein [Pseudanabaena sp. FACHB-2040]MBD2257124.1 hypothetical protein [Pseudanabaena sp. FACHB-2040]